MTASDQSLSVLCAGIRGGAQLSRYLDRPEALYAMGRCENRIRRAVESHRGRLVNRSGGKVMAFFGDSADALQSAIEMQHRVSDLPPYSGLPLSVRVGVCVGHQAKEERFFPSEGANSAASLADVADPQHILLSIPIRVKFAPALPMASESVPDLTLSCGNRRLGVFKMGWQDAAPAVLELPPSTAGNDLDQLTLAYRGAQIVLDSDQSVVRIGRHIDCEIKLRSLSSSRAHGTIERRRDCLVFVDRSTNGTFVTLEDEIEFFVHRKELVLYGCGQLSLGLPALTPGAELLEFSTSSFS